MNSAQQHLRIAEVQSGWADCRERRWMDDPKLECVNLRVKGWFYLWFVNVRVQTLKDLYPALWYWLRGKNNQCLKWEIFISFYRILCKIGEAVWNLIRFQIICNDSKFGPTKASWILNGLTTLIVLGYCWTHFKSPVKKYRKRKNNETVRFASGTFCTFLILRDFFPPFSTLFAFVVPTANIIHTC